MTIAQSPRWLPIKVAKKVVFLYEHLLYEHLTAVPLAVTIIMLPLPPEIDS